jgi:hypothetical protein
MVTVRVPTVALATMTILTVAWVASVIVIEVTVIPDPKLATVEPARKLVNLPTIATGMVGPAIPLSGVMVVREAAGLTVSAAEFELWNTMAGVAAELPEIVTLYAVGTTTTTDAGTVNVTRRVVPATVVTAVAWVATAAPPVAGVSVTVTFAAAIVPTGKFDPVTLTLVTPGSAALGEVLGKSVTAIGLWVRPSSAP